MLGQVVEQVARKQRCIDLGRRGHVTHAVALVHARPAELVARDLLAHHFGDDAGTGEEHARAVGHHDEVGERRRVGAAARRCAADHRDLRHHPGQRDVLAEDPAVARQSLEPLLHARARGLDETDHGSTRAACELQHPHDAVGVRLAQRPAGERRVLGEAEHRAPVDPAGGGQNAVALAGLLAHAPRPHLRAHELDRARIAQHLEPLQRAQALVSESFDELQRHAASRTTTALWPPKPSEFEIPTAARPSGAGSGRAAPGT